MKKGKYSGNTFCNTYRFWWFQKYNDFHKIGRLLTKESNDMIKKKYFIALTCILYQHVPLLYRTLVTLNFQEVLFGCLDNTCIT